MKRTHLSLHYLLTYLIIAGVGFLSRLPDHSSANRGALHNYLDCPLVDTCLPLLSISLFKRSFFLVVSSIVILGVLLTCVGYYLDWKAKRI